MRESLLKILACPLCHSDDLDLIIKHADEREIREGELICKSCQATMPIYKGIVHALLNPDQKVLNEAKGWVELLDVPVKQHEFRDDWILALPFIRPEQTPDQDSVNVWHQVGGNFMENLDRFDWQGKLVLEIGAGRCWGVAELARRGAEAVGVDILTHKYLGLETADVWFAAENPYFERVQADMGKLPFHPKTFDFVITTSSLHHTDTLDIALKEVERILHPEGYAFFINEPVIQDGHPKPDLSDSPEVLHNIIESRPTYSEWMNTFEQAGLGLVNVWFKNDMHVLLRKGPPLATPSSFVRASQKNHRWRRIEHRFWRAYDRIKGRVFKK